MHGSADRGRKSGTRGSRQSRRQAKAGMGVCDPAEAWQARNKGFSQRVGVPSGASAGGAPSLCTKQAPKGEPADANCGKHAGWQATGKIEGKQAQPPHLVFGASHDWLLAQQALC